MLMNDERRTTEEAYVSASTTSNLKLGPADGPNRDADVIIAAGMSSSVVGACLIRLHGEWSKVEKPRAPTGEAIQKLAGSLTFDQLVAMRVDLELHSIGNLKPGPALAEIAARAQAHAWYVAEVEMLLGKLKSFRQALDYLTAHLMNWDNRPEIMVRQTATEVLVWWLDKQCKVCGGTKYETAAGTNRHTKQPCRACRGTGLAKLPRQEDGRRLANYIDDSTQEAKTSISRRLRAR